jgi:ABC-2 type transport system ATP-binding protein
MITASPLIDVSALSKSYGGKPVIADVTFQLMRGGMIGLVGANGGGKTTTLRMLSGLIAPSSGGGTVSGYPLGSALARKRIGYMSQQLALYSELTVRENLTFRAEAYSIAKPRDQVSEFAEKYGLNSVLDARFNTLSGGWARRVQFVASIIHNPELLLLDEPTAGLDVATKRDIWAWLAELAVRGRGIVVSTHDLTEAARLPVILLYGNGRAGAAISPLQLMTKTGTATLEGAVLAAAAEQA